jgi:hypothetical protein
MSKITKEDQRALDALQRAVTEELERKRRLGQYAVVWQDGKVVCVGGDDAPAPQEHRGAAAGSTPATQ